MLLSSISLLCENHYIKRVDDALLSILRIIEKLHQDIDMTFENIHILLNDPDIVSTIAHIREYNYDFNDIRIKQDRLYIFSLLRLPENIIKDFINYRDSGTLPDYCEQFIEAMDDLGIGGTIDLVIGASRIDFDFSSMAKGIQDIIATKLRYNRGSGFLLINKKKLNSWEQDIYDAMSKILQMGKNVDKVRGSYFYSYGSFVRGSNFILVSKFHYDESSSLGSLSLPYEYDYKPKLVNSLEDFFDCFFRYHGRRLSMNFELRYKLDRDKRMFFIEMIFNMKKLQEQELHVSE